MSTLRKNPVVIAMLTRARNLRAVREGTQRM